MFEKHHDPWIGALERGTACFIVVLIAIVLTKIMKFSKVIFLLEKSMRKEFLKTEGKRTKNRREIKSTYFSTKFAH